MLSFFNILKLLVSLSRGLRWWFDFSFNFIRLFALSNWVTAIENREAASDVNSSSDSNREAMLVSLISSSEFVVVQSKVGFSVAGRVPVVDLLAAILTRVDDSRSFYWYLACS